LALAAASILVSTRPAAAIVISSVDFDQLDWVGLTSTTPNSSWGRMTLDFVGGSTTDYVNLNVNGQWVLQNVGVDSLFGTGVSQQVMMDFQIASGHGIDVPTINYGLISSPVPLLVAPPVTSSANVANLSYQIGGESLVNLGSPANPPMATGANAATVTMSARLPNIGSVNNQPQGPNECAPGAVSNSLMYLQATGQLPNSVDASLATMKMVLMTTASGSPADWPMKKRDHFAGTLMTQFLDPTDIMGLINAINAGKDVELDLAGHVAMIAGVRKFSDGRIELDIFDDNQTDNMSDPMRTVPIIGNTVDGMGIDRYVVEMRIPEPGTMVLALAALAAIVGRRCIARM
jgi:hypothetical protein